MEDDQLQASEMTFGFEARGCDVVGPHATLEEGLVAAKRASVDFAILDIKLGKAPVFQLADLLFQNMILFVFISGFDSSIIPQRFAHVPCLRKPLALDELEAAIDMELSRVATRH